MLLLRALSLEDVEKRIFFPSKIHRMKTRSGICGCNFNGLEEELADHLANGNKDDKG